MRKASTRLGLGGLTLVALAGSARAQEVTQATPVAATSATPAPARRFQVGLSFLPMALGKFSAVYGGFSYESDAAFAPGGSVSIGYEVIRGLTLGVAPQVILKVGPKEDPTMSGMPAYVGTEFDLMARVAYAYRFADTIAAYVEMLPGYSLILPSDGDVAKGFVLAVGAGAVIDMTDRAFASLGVGRQMGYQSVTSDKGVTTGVRPTYYRLALGVGWRF